MYHNIIYILSSVIFLCQNHNYRINVYDLKMFLLYNTKYTLNLLKLILRQNIQYIIKSKSGLFMITIF